MAHCNELCTKDATGTCALCEALAVRDQFIRRWFKGGLFIDGVPWLIERLRDRRKVLGCWWYPVPRTEVRPEAVVREAHKQYSESLNKTMLALLGVALFCLLTALGSPDYFFLAGASTIKIPFADTLMTLFGFIWVAPILLIVLTIYLHLFYGYWLECEWERQRINQSLITTIEGIPTLFSFPAAAPHLFTEFLFYWLVPLVLAVITWKAWGHPTMGRDLTYISGVVTIFCMVLRLRRRPTNQPAIWTRVSGTTLALAIFIMVLAMCWPQWFQRPLYLSHAVLSEQWLGGRDMHGASLDFASLQKANLQEACLHGANLRGANFREALLWKVNFQGAILLRADLQGAMAAGAKFWKANLREANLREANLSWADFWTADLRQAHLEDAHLEDANFGMVTIWRDNLQEEKPSEFAWGGADLQGAILQRAYLQRTQLQGAYLWKADLREAQLQEADLQGAKLQNAILQKADLQGANLGGVQLQGADLTEVKNLTQDQINQACTDENTKLPRELRKPPPCPPNLYASQVPPDCLAPCRSGCS